MQVLVLNQNYQAISLCSPERAFVLVMLRKADMVTEREGRKLRSVRDEFSFPSIIRLKAYVHLPYKKVALTRQNIFKRDGDRCVYCGSGDRLTLDHVLPRAQGGQTTWRNLATACYKCNSKKGDLTPEQAEMSMEYAPFRPSFIMFMSNFSGTVHEDWKPYLLMA